MTAPDLGRPAAFALAGLLAATLAGGAQAYVIDFDTLPSGAAASADPVAQAHGITFASGIFVPDRDADGADIVDPLTNQPIPGFQHWETDPSAPAITVGSPDDHLAGAAPSGPNALNAFYDQTLVRFAAPVTLGSFSVATDKSSYGFPGTVAIEFLGADGKDLGSFSYLQAGTSFISTNFATPLAISAIVLPSGKYYDNLNIGEVPAVPEPSAFAMALAGLASVVLARRWSARAAG